jgi:histidinol-phosphate aminotransferase
MIDELVPDNIKQLRAYQPGKPIEELERELGITDVIRISSNENAMGPSPRATEAAAAVLATANAYPNGDCYTLRTKLCDRLGITPQELVFGSGSNEVIDLVVRAFCRPGIDEIVAQKYSFISYRLAAMAHNIRYVESDVTDLLGCDVEALLATVTDKTRVVFLANPNNPTGAYLPRAEFERLLAELPAQVILVVDEAYHEFAIDAGVEDYPNSLDHRSDRALLITMRTFSKIYGLAGLRVGYGISLPAIIDYMNRIRRPFNVNSVAQAAAVAALDDTEHIERSRKAAHEGIPAIIEAMVALGFRAYPSLGNFVLIDVRQDATPVYERLLRRGVIVRPMGPWGLPAHLRVSVGTPEQTARVIGTLTEVLSP